MFKYNLGDKVFAVYKNKISEGKILARKCVENIDKQFYIFRNEGITYAVSFEKNKNSE